MNWVCAVATFLQDASFLGDQKRRLLQAYARYVKQRRKKERAQKKESIQRQIRGRLGWMRP